MEIAVSTSSLVFGIPYHKVSARKIEKNVEGIFFAGWRYIIRNEVDINGPTPLEDTIDVVLKIEKKPLYNQPRFNHNSRMNKGKMGGNSSKMKNYHGGKARKEEKESCEPRTKKRKFYNSLTPQQKQKYFFEGRCFQCGDRGHNFYECPRAAS